MADYTYPTAFNTFSDEERAAALRVVQSGQLTIGAEVRAFEGDFAAFHGRRHGIMCNSGSSANLLMVAALANKTYGPLKRGDKVAVPAVAWSTTYAPLIQYGLKPVLLDVDASWNATPHIPQFDPSRFDGMRLIIGCSILGIPAQLRAWKAIASVIGAYFVEDNCESVGATDSYGQLCGTYGLMSSFSFFWSHQVNGIEGGMVLTDDDELADLCRMLRSHGWTRDVRPRQQFEDEYDFRVMGYNLRPLEMHAAVAAMQFHKLTDSLAWRYENAMRFYSGLEGLRLGVTQPIEALRGNPSMFGIHMMLPAGTRQRAVEALRASGIDCRLPAGGSFAKHAYGAPWAVQATPMADLVHENGLFIGNAPFDIRDKVEQAVDVLRVVFDGWNGRRAEEAAERGEFPKRHHGAACDPA